MTPKSRPSRTGLRFIGTLKNAIDMHASGGPATLCHLLPVALPAGDPPMSFTVFLAADAMGHFRLTCRELPGLRTIGADEEEALTQAELAIRDALDGRPSSAGPPT